MIFTEEHRLPQIVRRSGQVAVFELSQTQIEEQIPISKPKCDGKPILTELRGLIARHSFGKTQMIVSERAFGMHLHDLRVKANRLRVVFDAEGIICVNIADLLPSALAIRAIPSENSNIAAANAI